MPKKPHLKTKQPTMHDVAKLAGVSQSTVSRVLYPTDLAISISDETKQRIYKAVEALGYQPNILARSLRTQRTQMIAVMIGDISNSFYHPMVRAIQDVAKKHGYDVLIASTDHLHENEAHFCEAVMRRPVDGVIMVPFQLPVEEISRFVNMTHTPLVVFGNHVDLPQVDFVYVNDEQATYNAVNWLVHERGHQRIAQIAVSETMPPGPRRSRGYFRALADAGIAADPQLTALGDFTLESGKAAMRELLQVSPLPTAVMTLNDLMAIGAIQAIVEAGLRVPDDIAVVGFDDIPECTLITPQLTTVGQSSRDIGHQMAEALFQRLEAGTALQRCEYEIPSELVIRTSA